MFIYQHRVREEFLRVRDYAANLRNKFHAKNAKADDLLLDVKSLRTLYERLNEMLPDSVKNNCHAARHIKFMEYWLGKNDRRSCISDIGSICDYDIEDLENAFHSWCENPDHYDFELVQSISDLLAHRQVDSAIRKSFVVLKERLCKNFGASRDLDGPELVNKIFGKGSTIQSLSESERQAMRDLLAGLYGVFRNRFAHRNEAPSWSEADAIISMINNVLQELGRIKGGV